jgi:hypothetical protein
VNRKHPLRVVISTALSGPGYYLERTVPFYSISTLVEGGWESQTLAPYLDVEVGISCPHTGKIEAIKMHSSFQIGSYVQRELMILTTLSGYSLFPKRIVHIYSYLRGTPLQMGRQQSQILAHVRSFAMAQEYVGLDEIFLNEKTYT